MRLGRLFARLLFAERLSASTCLLLVVLKVGFTKFSVMYCASHISISHRDVSVHRTPYSFIGRGDIRSDGAVLHSNRSRTNHHDN